MITAINNTQQPSFQAKLELKGIKLRDQQKICERFEAITQHYKSDVLEVAPQVIEKADGSTFKNTNFACNGRNVGFMIYLKEFIDFCKQHTTEEIAKSLSKIFKAAKQNEVHGAKMTELQKGKERALTNLNRAEYMPNSKISESLTARSLARLENIEQQTASEQTKHNTITEKILKDDPINENFYLED